MRRATQLFLPLAILATLSLCSSARAQGGMPVGSSGGLTTTLQPEDGMTSVVSSPRRPVTMDALRTKIWLAYFALRSVGVQVRTSLQSRHASAKLAAVRVPQLPAR